MPQTRLGNLPIGSKLMAYKMPWQGDPSRISRVSYDARSLSVINAQLTAMQRSGIDGVIGIWQGPTRNHYTNTAFVNTFLCCVQRDMPFLVMLDQWVAKALPDPTQAVIDALHSDVFTSIIPFCAEQWVLEFDLGPSAGVDLAKVRAAFPKLQILSKHVGYSWPEVTNTWAVLQADNANPQMQIPGIFAGFDDGGYPLPDGVSSPSTYNGLRDWNNSVWDRKAPKRVIDPHSGNTFLDSIAAIARPSKYVGLVTWDDYDEGTQWESQCAAMAGIRIG